MMPERLVQAAGAARREGYVDEVEYGRLIECLQPTSCSRLP